MPPIQPILRASLGSTSASNGHTLFVRPIRKLIIEYCEQWGSSDGMRRFVASASGVEKLARNNPSVEFIVRRRPNRHPVVRGLYVNNRDKVVCVRNLEPSAIEQKVQLVLDASGDKLRREKGHPVKSTTESVRGIYSPFHTPWHGAENLGRLR
ncbi:39S ribosomal protein L51, mitochondrial [Cystobasidiomycetes sp. EMM_F5]